MVMTKMVTTKMETFKNLVIQYNHCDDEMKLAGIHDRWKRAMIISDTGLPAEVRDGTVAVLMPAGETEEELSTLTHDLEQLAIKPSKYVNSAVGVAQFYTKQEAIDATDKDLVVIDVNNLFTDICLLKRDGRTYSIKKTVRTDYGSDSITEELLELPRYAPLKEMKAQLSEMMRKELSGRPLEREKFLTNKDVKLYSHNISLKRQDIVDCMDTFLVLLMASIDNLLFREKIKKPTLLLSGKLWEWQEACWKIKKRFAEFKVVSYRPKVAALLGAAYYLQDNSATSTACTVSEEYVKLHYTDIWGEVNRLNKLQQEGYWKLLEAVMEGKEEVVLRGDNKDLYKMYYALHIDFPEVRMIWSYGESKLSSIGTQKNPYIKLYPVYNTSGRTLMDSIDKKSDEILRKCVHENICSDKAIIQKLYFYISKHYHYTKDKTSTGKYPDYAYTLETLLRCGVCHGYATSLIFLLRRLQVPILYVGGDADGNKFGGHAWNMIPTESGEFRHLDITWDLETARSNKVMKHYLLDDIAMKSRRHFWNAQEYPVCV
jgi:hypothetical protein